MGLADFLSFNSHRPHQITEGLEIVFIAVIVVVIIAIVLCIYGGCRYCEEKCECCRSRCTEPQCRRSRCAECCRSRCAECCRLRCAEQSGADHVQDDGQSKIVKFLQHCLSPVLSSVFDVIEPAKENCKITLLFAKKRRPKSGYHYGYVLFYFTILLVLLFFLFLSMFCNFFIYRKTSTCNDINVANNHYICFNINDGYSEVDCHLEKYTTDSNLEVICYLTDWDFFRALGIAFGAIQAFRTLISTFFSFGITIGKKSPGAMITYQCIGSVLSILSWVGCYVLLYKYCMYKVWCGDAVQVHITVNFAHLISLCLFLGHPWWAFKDDSFEQTITKIGERNYLTDVEYQPQAQDQQGGSNISIPSPNPTTNLCPTSGPTSRPTAISTSAPDHTKPSHPSKKTTDVDVTETSPLIDKQSSVV